MKNQEEIEKAEGAIEFYKNLVKDYNTLIVEQEAKLSDLKKQAEPKEGEWWYMQTYEGEDKGHGDSKGVLRIKSVSGLRAYYTEHYDEINGYFNDYLRLDQPVFRPATTEEITYFMGLHADRLGIKEGVKIKDVADNIFTFKPTEKIRYYPEFDLLGLVDLDECYWTLREADGAWANVVTEKPKNGKLKAKIAELEERIQKAKDILDGK